MSIDDRIRAATEATAATVREIRPLALPGEATAAHPRRPRRRRARRGLGGWLIPIAAAAAMVAVAVTLVVVKNPPRQAGKTGQAPAASRSAQPGTTTAPADAEAVPDYFVAIQGFTHLPTKDPRPDSVVVGETLTGKRLATIVAGAGSTFVGVTGAADDRTFVLDCAALPQPNGLAFANEPRTWSVLRIRPGAATGYTMTRLSLPVPPAADINGIALSPDGTKLAILYQVAGSGAGFPYNGPFTLGIYSVATGAALRTWTGAAPYHGSYGYGADGLPDPNANLTWTSDGQRLAFAWRSSGGPSASLYLREVNLASPGDDLFTDSRVIATVAVSTTDGRSKIWCDSLGVTGDGRYAVCGAELPATPPVGGTLDALTEPAPLSGCAAPTDLAYPGLVEISLPGDKLARLLYEDKPACAGAGEATVLWSSPSGDTVLGAVDDNAGGSATEHLAVVLYRQGSATTVNWPGAAGLLTADEVAF